MRLFIAIPLSPALREELTGLQRRMFDAGARGSFTPKENLHLTLAFLGERPQSDPVLEALERVTFTPVPLTLAGVGCFGDLWWAGVSDSPAPAAAANPARLEAAVRWMDYHYTDEGSTLLMYGIEGESFEYVNGEPQFLPIVYQHPDGLAFGDARELWTEKNGGQWYRWECENIAFPARVLESYDIWNRADGAWVLPNTSLTTEEGNEYSALYGDIQTFVQESIPAFITGAKSLDDWDSFVAQIKTLNIDRCIELQQAALDRYFAR